MIAPQLDQRAAAAIEAFLNVHPEGGHDDLDRWLRETAADGTDAELHAAVHLALSDRKLDGPSSPDAEEVARSRFFGARPAPGGESGASNAAQLHPGRRLGPFLLRKFIASGGMGQVWEAEEIALRRLVALKLVLPGCLEPRTLELFAREARAGARLQHANIVKTLSFGSDEGLTWIAQELVPGSWTLRDSIQEMSTNPEPEKGYFRGVGKLVRALADALDHAHTEGVIHRDIKPANILIAPDDSPRLVDFGLARVTDDSVYSVTGDFAGTLAYMSPEQLTSKRMGLDHRTDIFSLGVVLYELCTRQRPFSGDTTQDVAQQIIGSTPRLASKVDPECPKDLAHIAAKAMEKHPSSRYAQASDLVRDLDLFLDGKPVSARSRSRRPWMSRAVLYPLALALIGGAVAKGIAGSRAPEVSGGSATVAEVTPTPEAPDSTDGIDEPPETSLALGPFFELPETTPLPLETSDALQRVEELIDEMPGQYVLQVVPRSEWGAKPAFTEQLEQISSFHRITVHHTATFEAPQSDGGEAIRRVQYRHLNSNGWADIGYHYLVDSAGRVFEGRWLGYQGAHAGRDSATGENHNEGNIGIALLGDFDDHRPSERQVSSLLALVESLKVSCGIATDDVYQHSDFKEVTCPGALLSDVLPDALALHIPWGRIRLTDIEDQVPHDILGMAIKGASYR